MSINHLIITTMVITLLFLEGCGSKPQIGYHGAEVKDEYVIENRKDASYDQSYGNISCDDMFFLGQKTKMLIDDKSMDEAVITVDGTKIDRRSIEILKVTEKISPNVSQNIKIMIEGAIKGCVIENEANRQGIKGSNESVDVYVNHLKEVLTESVPDNIKSYMEGMQIDIDAYCEMQRERMYLFTQKSNLFKKYNDDRKDDIEKEAERRNTTVDQIKKEYEKNYLNELVKKADIKILDDNVKCILNQNYEDDLKHEYMEYLKKLANNKESADVLISKTYSNSELQDFNVLLRNIVSRDKAECVRLVGDIIYIIFKSEKNYLCLVYDFSQNNVDYPVSIWYSDNDITQNDFDILQIGVSSLNDVLSIDPYGKYTYSPENDLYISKHFTYDGAVFVLEYDLDSSQLKQITKTDSSYQLDEILLPQDKEFMLQLQNQY